MQGASAGRLVGLALIAALALGGCAKPTPYRAGGGGYGYDSQALSEERHRVSFAGNAATPRKTVENYLLYRAAELTLEEGGDHFVVLYREIERHGNYPNTGPGWHTSFGLGHCWGCGWRDGVSAGVVLGVPVAGYPREQYRAFAEIAVRPGPPPADDRHAYDAREVIARLGPEIVREKSAGGN